LYDLYHGYIGDKATLYYGFLLRYRHNEEDENYGKSWNGRKGIAEKFQLSYSTLPVLDRILEIAELVEITTVPSGRGKERIVYTVHDPLTREQFRWRQPEIAERLRQYVEENKAAATLVGKEFKKALSDGK
jgi:hypothetical protein